MAACGARADPSGRVQHRPRTPDDPRRSAGSVGGSFGFVVGDGGELRAEVWGTQGLNECPAASWDGLDYDAIQAETGALAVIMNGPRLILPNSGVEPGGGSGSSDRRFFGDLEMGFKGTLEIDPADGYPV